MGATTARDTAAVLAAEVQRHREELPYADRKLLERGDLVQVGEHLAARARRSAWLQVPGILLSALTGAFLLGYDGEGGPWAPWAYPLAGTGFLLHALVSTALTVHGIASLRWTARLLVERGGGDLPDGPGVARTLSGEAQRHLSELTYAQRQLLRRGELDALGEELRKRARLWLWGGAALVLFFALNAAGSLALGSGAWSAAGGLTDLAWAIGATAFVTHRVTTLRRTARLLRDHATPTGGGA